MLTTKCWGSLTKITICCGFCFKWRTYTWFINILAWTKVKCSIVKFVILQYIHRICKIMTWFALTKSLLYWYWLPKHVASRPSTLEGSHKTITIWRQKNPGHTFWYILESDYKTVWLTTENRSSDSWHRALLNSQQIQIIAYGLTEAYCELHETTETKYSNITPN